MIATHIKATNLKGRSFSLTLCAFTMIAGPNDAGKSAIADAVRLALLGYLPELGKSNSATFALSSGSKMGVEAWFGESSIAREWRKTGKSVKLVTEGAELPETPLVMLNAAEYFAKSDRARVDMLFGVLRLDPKAFSREAVTAKIVSAVSEIGKLDDLEKLLQQTTGETLDEWITGAGDALDFAKADATSNARRFEQTVQGIVQLRAHGALVDAQAVTSGFVELDARRTAAEQRLGTLREQYRASEESERARRQCIQAIETHKAKVGDRPVLSIQSIDHEMASANEAVGSLKAGYDAALKQYQEIQGRAARAQIISEKLRAQLEIPDANLEAVATIEKELATMPAHDVSGTQQAFADANGALAAVTARQQGNDAAKQRAEQYRETHMQSQVCPTCGTAGEDFHAAIEQAFAARIAELDSEAALIAEEFRRCTEAFEASNRARNTALELERRRQRLTRDLDLQKIANTRAAAAAVQISQYREQLEQLGDATLPQPLPPPELARTQARLDQLRQEHARACAAETLATAQATLQTLPPPAAEVDEAMYSVECELAALGERRLQLEGDQLKVTAQLADERTMEEAKAKQERELTREQLLKVAREALAAERERIINEALKPLLDQVNIFTAGILPTPLEFHEGELGRYSGASWVPVRVFGGCFTAVTYAGLQAALGAQAPAKLCIVDELGRLDAVNKIKFLANIKTALNTGVLEQFIGIDVDPGFYLTPPAFDKPRTVAFEGLHLIPVKQ